MKKAIIIFLIGLFVGLLIGGLFWSREYISLYNKYYTTREAIQLLKPTPTPTPEVYNWYFDGEKISGENPFGELIGLVEDYCGIGKGTTIVNYDGMMETDCVPKQP